LCGKENGEQGAIQQATQVVMMITYYYKACIWMTMMMKDEINVKMKLQYINNKRKVMK
jgi:hypothetical protein